MIVATTLIGATVLSACSADLDGPIGMTAWRNLDAGDPAQAIQFDDSIILLGRTRCGRFSGDVTVEADRLAIRDIRWTPGSTCTASETEAAHVRIRQLEDDFAFALDSDRLRLVSGRTTLSFSRVPYDDVLHSEFF